MQGHAPAADAVEQGFQFVGDGGQVVETEHAAGALDRVRGAEDAVEGFRFRLVEIEADQQQFEGGQVFVGFLEEHLEKLAHAVHAGHPYGRTLRVTSSSFGGSNGLTSQPLAPAARPCCFMASLDSVVSMRIGTPR
ncbi:hypothetical protein D3C78_923180 [compost metagenome]